MFLALATDLAAIAGVEVAAMRDVRLDVPDPSCLRVYPVRSRRDDETLFARLAAQSDWTVVIAPEFDGHLLDRCRRVISAGGRLLGPSPTLVEMAADKHRTAEHLTAAGVPVPEGLPLDTGQLLPAGIRGPALLKPRFGAGSQGIRLLRSTDTGHGGPFVADCPSRLERVCPGTAVSVALLCGAAGRFPLVPCHQHLSDDGRFTYLGGSLPVEDRLARRATELAGRALTAMPDAYGYLGVDLVLGADACGGQDVVIEINPRLTTSYVGLRAAVGEGVNLAEAMLDVCEGRRPRLSFRPGRLHFEPDGTVHPLAGDP